VRLGHLDLNLLIALDALLEERNVSAAAERLFLSQSATSSALGRLREYFKDDLLVLKGRTMVATARGEELVEPVKAVLEQIRTTIAVSPDFESATSDRSIGIMCTDYVTQVLLADALKKFEQEAPNMRFEILAMTDVMIEVFERGLADILITIDHACAKRHPTEHLFNDEFVVIGCKDNPYLEEELTLETFLSLKHVAASFGRTRVPSFEDWYLRYANHERSIVATTPNFALVAPLLIGTQRISTVHRLLAEELIKQYPIVIKKAPIEIPPINLSIQWHQSASTDPAINWVVENLVQMAREKTGKTQGDKSNDNIFKTFQKQVGSN
jgi:DNA-binding transcriptional LysR family regulator